MNVTRSLSRRAKGAMLEPINSALSHELRAGTCFRIPLRRRLILFSFYLANFTREVRYRPHAPGATGNSPLRTFATQ